MLSSNIFRFLDEPLYGSLYIPGHYYGHHNKKKDVWSVSIPVPGYEPNEVAIKEEKDDKGETKLVVHAKHNLEDEYSEFRKCIKIPKNVDHEHMRTIMSKEGVLILKAPYLNKTDNHMESMKVNREDSWNGIWNEFSRLNEQMNQLTDVYGTMNRPRKEFIADESGKSCLWRLKLYVGNDFKPEEVKVRHQNKQIHLEAKKEEKGNNSYSSRFVSEVISIPDGVEAEKLQSKFMNNGEIVVEAPCKELLSVSNGDNGHVIPMEVVKSNDGDSMAMDN